MTLAEPLQSAAAPATAPTEAESIPVSSPAPVAPESGDVHTKLLAALRGPEVKTAQPTEEAGPETPAAPPAEVEPEAGETPEPDEGEEEDRSRRGLLGEVKSLREDRRELRTQLETLQRELAELQAQAQKPPAAPVVENSPLANLTAAELEEFATGTKRRLRQIEDHMDGLLNPAERGEFEKWARTVGVLNDGGDVDDAAVKRLRRHASDLLTEEVPKRREFLKAEAQFNAQAEQRWPWWKDRNSQEHRIAQEAMQALPGVRVLPHWKAIVSLWVRGYLAEMAGQQAAAAPAPTPKAVPPKPKLPTVPTASPAAESTDPNARIEALRKRARETGDPRDREKLLSAQLAMSMAGQG